MILDRALETAKAVDEQISYRIFKAVPKTGRIKSILKGLEWSGNGLFWLGGCLVLVYLFPSKESFKQFFAGLIMDIVYVALIKAYARRRRPTYTRQDDQFGVIGVDKHSFPSGHATRALYVGCFCCSLFPVFSFLVWMWAIAVSLSRVALGRHHVFDVVAGVVVGIGNYFLQFVLGLPFYTLFVWFLSSGFLASFSTNQDYTDATLSGND